MYRPTSLLAFALAFASYATVTQAQTPPAAPKPGPEIKKLAIMVGKFTNEGEVKAGTMGPNSPAQKATGTDDCRWVAGGFGVLCNSTTDMGGLKYTEVAIIFYDPASKMYHYHSVDNAGDVGSSTGTVRGDTWTWTGEGVEAGKVKHSRFTMKVNSKDSFDYTVDSGDSESSMQPVMSGKEVRVTMAAKPAMSKPASQ
jgi:Protein of unknown function (DUF1579)